MTISIPDRAKAWVEEQVRTGLYETASDYVHDLISRDQGRRAEELTLDELRQKLAVSKASGITTRTVDQIFAEAASIARARGHLNE